MRIFQVEYYIIHRISYFSARYYKKPQESILSCGFWLILFIYRFDKQHFRVFAGKRSAPDEALNVVAAYLLQCF